MDMNELRDGLAITGTGADCIIVATRDTGAPATSAGLHTGHAEAIGAASMT